MARVPKPNGNNNPCRASVYTAAFIRSLHFSLRWEGGYSDDPFDPGGATMYGVTINTLTRWWRYLKRDGTPTPMDVKKLTPEEAHRIYHEWYWTPCKCESLPSGVALVVFDCAINQGPGRAKRLLQKALRVKADGIIGRRTMAAIDAANQEVLLRDFCARRAVHYSSLGNVVRFGYGWFRRLFAAQQEALDLVSRR